MNEEINATAAAGRLLVAIVEAKAQGMTPGTFIGKALRSARLDESRNEIVTDCLQVNLSVAHALGHLTPENIERMRRGETPVITLGYCHGQQVWLRPLRTAAMAFSLNSRSYRRPNLLISDTAVFSFPKALSANSKKARGQIRREAPQIIMSLVLSKKLSNSRSS